MLAVVVVPLWRLNAHHECHHPDLLRGSLRSLPRLFLLESDVNARELSTPVREILRAGVDSVTAHTRLTARQCVRAQDTENRRRLRSRVRGKSATQAHAPRLTG